MNKMIAVGAAVLGTLLLMGCGDDDSSEDRSLGAECNESIECTSVAIEDGPADIQLECSNDFHGGYCTIPDCESNADCPADSVCVTSDNGNNYCFSECDETAECNAERTDDTPGECSDEFDFASADDEDADLKVCLPPAT